MENQNPTKHNRGLDKRAVLGIIFVLIGGLFLLHNYDLIPRDVANVIFTWEMILIVIGVYNLLTQRFTSAIILIGIGVFFLLPDVYDLPVSFHKLFWPAIFILVGIIFIFRKKVHASAHIFKFSTKSSIDYIDDVSIFGGGENYITSQNFKGGRITAFFGGSTYILKDAKLADGVNKIDIFTMFGGSKLIVPNDWKVKVEVVSIFGGYNDKRRTINTDINDNKELVIKGIVIFGGGEIISY